ncbi:hypothetical protein GGI12_000716 [Dipsacomyces acuminosporus]|nr:hypothetical protein GGI12_000716 [Dipsacomyces acuminosporus]
MDPVPVQASENRRLPASTNGPNPASNTSKDGDSAGNRTPPYTGPADGAAKDDNADLEGIDATVRAMRLFEGVDKNILVRVTTDGTNHEESIPCLCRYNPDRDPRSQACGESSDCINRLVQMECNPLTCPCGSYCLNRRFQKRQYAKVRVIDAGRKGFGLQALEDLDPGAFVMEYMGEIVSAGEFKKRARVYQTEGIKHHYFMSIGSSKVIDATRKGCIARFINHSCGPNCVLQKWMVAGAVRMGIFVQRPIKRGEEITFDYKFERLAEAEPQPCYCGSPECKGVIGITKERRKKSAEDEDISEDVNDDLADIDEEIDGSTVTGRQRDDIRRRHAAVDDDEYGSSSSSDEGDGDDDDEDDDGSDNGFYGTRNSAHRRRKPKRGLSSPEQVLKFVQIMHRSSRQTRIICTLIGKLMETTNRRLLKSFIGLQGVGILRAWLQDYENDDVMLIKILQCIAHLPISTRNTIEESKMEETAKQLCSYSDENVAAMASELVERWRTLRHVFKIPKKSRKESTNTTPANGTPTVSGWQSPSHQANDAPPPTSSTSTNTNTDTDNPVNNNGNTADGWTIHSTQSESGWQISSVNSARMRSASPSTRDAFGSSPAHHTGVSGWGRRGFGYRGQSPRSPGRQPYSGFGSRYSQRDFRSRSPGGFRRTSSYSRFPRSSTNEYPPTRSYGRHSGADQHTPSGYGTPNSQSRGRYGGWGNSTPHRVEDDQSYNGRTVDGADASFKTQWEPPLAEPSTEKPSSSVSKLESQTMPSKAPSSTTAAADRRPGAGESKLDGGYATNSISAHSADDVKVNGFSKAKVDEIIERTMRLASQPQGGAMGSSAGQPDMSRNSSTGGNKGASTATATATAKSMQLVTPDTDGEPAAATASSQSQPSTSLAGSKAHHKRDSPKSSLAMPAAKREKIEKKATAELATFVVRTLNKYKGQMDHTEFKHEAKKITKILMEKERKSSSFDPLKLVELSTHKKTKIKQFVTDYMTKIADRKTGAESPTSAAATAAVIAAAVSAVKTPPEPSSKSAFP